MGRYVPSWLRAVITKRAYGHKETAHPVARTKPKATQGLVWGSLESTEDNCTASSSMSITSPVNIACTWCHTRQAI